MAHFKNDGVKVSEFTYDFAVDGGATGVFSLSSKANHTLIPDGAVIQKVVTKVVTAFAGSGASAKIGTTTSDSVYLALTDVSGYSTDAMFDYTTLVCANTANKRNVIMSLSGGALTAGKLVVNVEYVLPAAQ